MSSNQLRRVRYTPTSKVRKPWVLLASMQRDLLASRELAWRLMVRDISAQYRQSFLGFFWAFMPSIAIAMGLTFARNTGVVNIDSTAIPYPIYVVLSMTLWQTFVESLNGPAAAIRSTGSMLTKINFPHEAIILAKVGEIFFNFAIKLVLLVSLFLWFRMPVSWLILLSPLSLLHLVLLGIGLGLWLAPIGALYKDIQQTLLLITAPWMILTPVVYDIPAEGHFRMLVRLNPVTPLLVTTRELATTGILTETQGFWWSSGLMLFLLLSGWILYKLAMPLVIERMGS